MEDRQVPSPPQVQFSQQDEELGVEGEQSVENDGSPENEEIDYSEPPLLGKAEVPHFFTQDLTQLD